MFLRAWGTRALAVGLLLSLIPSEAFVPVAPGLIRRSALDATSGWERKHEGSRELVSVVGGAARSEAHRPGGLALSMAATKEVNEGLQLADLGPTEVLKKMVSSRTSEADKTQLVEQIRALRSVDEAKYRETLDSMASEIESVSDNQWAMRKYPIRLPSYRTKLGCMKRMLDRVLDGDTNRKQAAVATLLRQLPAAKGAWGLEQEVDRRLKDECTMEEMLSRTPEGLETPSYKVLAKRKEWEVREYEEFSVCSFKTESTSSPMAFNALAGYIFGQNKEQTKMAMTTPVINTPNGKMSFVVIAGPNHAGKVHLNLFDILSCRCPRLTGKILQQHQLQWMRVPYNWKREEGG